MSATTERDLTWLIGRPVWRLPCGRTCRVLDADNAKRRIKIQDHSLWVGWVEERSFFRNWGYREFEHA